jgi:D-beta-D-heptose 7-phosphate kinase/D-beta-D-heptose 1-phosphate adenosyltransferase
VGQVTERDDRGKFQFENGIFSCYPLNVPAKLKDVDELKEIVAQAKANGKSIVFTNGCFDLLHRGHVHLLRKAKSCGDILIVAINSDRSVNAIKGPNRPILTETDRIELIAAMEMVDYVILFEEPDPDRLIAALRPNILVKGGDWSSQRIVGAEIVERDGGKVVVVPYLKGFSTTEIIERIRS